MYEWTDTKRNIKNTFAPDLIAKGTYCMQEIIYLVTKGFMKRDCVPPDILKRMDAEIKFVRETLVEKTKPLL